MKHRSPASKFIPLPFCLVQLPLGDEGPRGFPFLLLSLGVCIDTFLFVRVCVCRHRVSLSFGLPASCSHLPLAALNWKTEGRCGLGMQPVLVSLLGTGQGREGWKDTEGGHRGCAALGLTHACLPCQAIGIGHCLHTQRIMECECWKSP